MALYFVMRKDSFTLPYLLSKVRTPSVPKGFETKGNNFLVTVLKELNPLTFRSF